MDQENKEHFDLSDSLRDDMKDNSNKKVLGKFKDELHSLPMKEWLALNPKVYSMIHNEFDKEKQELILDKNTKKCKGVSKAVVKNNITHDDYKNVLNNVSDKPFKKEITSIRSFKHQIHTIKEDKVALTSYYDKMNMIDGNTCIPCGYLQD